MSVSRTTLRNRVSVCTLSLALFLGTAGAIAAEDRKVYVIEAQSTAAALNAFARQSGLQLMFDYAEAARTTAPVLKGSYTRKEALSILLANTRFEVGSEDAGVVYLKVSERQGSAGAAAVEAEPTEVIVTGTRIRGREPTSPVTRLTQAQIQMGGHADLGEMARALPQNFGGGANPGIAIGTPDLRNSNNNAASTFNLRGLGPDATLTLLNGNRLAYDSIGQAVDVSAVPLAAVDRVEIVTDGASALYGSDAVGGVVNIRLKRDFEGLAVAARYAASTEGGNAQKGVSLTAGRTWTDGGFLIAADLSAHSGLYARDRTYTRNLDATTTLIPQQDARLLVLTGHQRLTSALSFSVDALLSERKSLFTKANDVGVTYLDNGSRETPRVHSYSVSPRLSLDLNGGWQTYWSATVGEDKTELNTDAYLASTRTATYPGHYLNRTVVSEVGGEGPVFSTAVGSARLALGAGYRKIDLDGYLAFDYVSGFSIVATDFKRGRTSRYAFAELFVPVVSALQDIPGVRQLSLTGAVRTERYSGADSVTTPKIGVVYAPVNGVDLKVSWGKSFKMPTLYQSYRGELPYLMDTSLISTTTPAGSTFLYLDGANDHLDPETAETWVATAALRPGSVPGLRLELSAFDIAYRDRVMQPILSLSGALQNPAYAGSVFLNPTPSQIAAAIGDMARLRNYSSGVFDPAKVVAIVDNREQNVFRQAISGYDISLQYGRPWQGGSLGINGTLSYLKSRQTLDANGAGETLAGTIFNPPHWRGRFGASWQSDSLTLAGFANYVGAFDDDRFGSRRHIAAQTTYDATVQYRFAGATDRGVSVSLSILNLFDETPETIRTAAAFYVPYDATNHAASGRVVSVTLGTRW